MILFKRRYDGGNESNVTGFWLFEIKWLCSIVILRFRPSHRENYHSHAFNAFTVWLKGEVIEECIDPRRNISQYKLFRAGQAKFTPRQNIHKIHCAREAWCISFRGPWSRYWIEYNRKDKETLYYTHGRNLVGRSKCQSEGR